MSSETQGLVGHAAPAKARLALAAGILACVCVLGALVKFMVAEISTPESGLACNHHATGPTALATARKFVSECGSGFGVERQIDAFKSSSGFASYAQVDEFVISVPAGAPSGPALFVLVGRKNSRESWRTLDTGTGP